MSRNPKTGSVYNDLNNTLFLQLDRLQDCDKDEVEVEIQRSKQVANLGAQVIANQNAALSMLRFAASEGMGLEGLRSIMPGALPGGRGERGDA